MIVYEGALHRISGSPATIKAPYPGSFAAEWLKDRFDGKPMTSKPMKVDASGELHDFCVEDALKAPSVSLLWRGAKQKFGSPVKPTQDRDP